MKLFIIYGRQLNLFNGSNVHTIEVFNNFQDMGVDVFLFSKSTKNGSYRNSNIIEVPSTHFQFLFSNYLNMFTYQLSLFLYLIYYSIKLRPDLFYTRLSGNSVSSTIVASILRITQVGEVNGLTIDEMIIQGSSKSNIKIAQLIENINFSGCSKLIAVTDGVKKGLMEMYSIPESKIVVINNGANTKLFVPMDKDKVKRDLNLDSSLHYICFVGNLIPWQGVEYLIRAAPLILEKDSNVRFLVVGDGVMKKEWMKLADGMGLSGNFIFTGAVPYEMVPIYINASDICVVPKKPIKSGYSPLKLYEYMACGKPIIATRTNGFEVLEEENAGILINSEDPVEFSNSLSMLLGNPELMTNMGNNGRKYVVANHSWNKVVRMVLDVCNDVIKNH